MSSIIRTSKPPSLHARVIDLNISNTSTSAIEAFLIFECSKTIALLCKEDMYESLRTMNYSVILLTVAKKSTALLK